MPRKGRGGKVDGAAQTAYANRTDLNERGPQPITVAPGQAYGEAEMQRQAQQAVPMGGTPMPNVQAALPVSAPLGAGIAPVPGTLAWADTPSQRPNEPITHGLPIGPGAGPEAVAPIPDASPGRKLSDILGTAAAHPAATHRVQALAELAKALEG